MPTQAELVEINDLRENLHFCEYQLKELAHQFLRVCMILDKVGKLDYMPEDIRALYQKQLDALTARNTKGK